MGEEGKKRRFQGNLLHVDTGSRGSYGFHGALMEVNQLGWFYEIGRLSRYCYDHEIEIRFELFGQSQSMMYVGQELGDVYT
jgi:hypothetical protein